MTFDRNGSVWKNVGAYGCVTDALESIRMHLDAYGCIQGTKYYALGNSVACFEWCFVMRLFGCFGNLLKHNISAKI